MSAKYPEKENPKLIIEGAAMLEVASYDEENPANNLNPTWYTVGPYNTLKVTENLEVSTVERDNTKPEDKVTKHELTVSCERTHIQDENVRRIIRGDFDTVVDVSGAEVSGKTQVIPVDSATLGNTILIGEKNADGLPVEISAVNVSGGAALTEGTDYGVSFNDSSGETYIVPLISGSFNTGLAHIITYDYTPSAGRKTTTGGRSKLPFFQARITHKTNDDKTVYIHAYKGNITKGVEWAFKKATESDPAIMEPVEFIFREDDARGDTDNLYEKYDTKSIAA